MLRLGQKLTWLKLRTAPVLLLRQSGRRTFNSYSALAKTSIASPEGAKNQVLGTQ
jgi:hypothetical protein